jgi:hypothetical protein
MKPTFEQVAAAVRGQGHAFFVAGDFNLNLVGIRAAGGNPDDTFNDTLAVLFYQQRRPMMLTMACTTDPGRHYLENPLTERGTAILKPGQYRGMWRLGLHRGQYEALVQNRACTVYRDNNRDPFIDADDSTIDRGLFGINCHRAAEAQGSRRIRRWSAGCQVVQNPCDFQLLLSLARVAATRWGDSLTYTLLSEDQL